MCFSKFAIQAFVPLKGVRHGIRRRRGKDRDGEETSANDAGGKQDGSIFPRKRCEGLCGLAGCLDVKEPMTEKRHGRGGHDQNCDELGKRHADQCIFAHAPHFGFCGAASCFGGVATKGDFFLDLFM